MQAHRLYQDVLIELGREDEARREYQDWAESEGERAEALCLYGRLVRDPEQQEQLFRRAEDIAPGFVWAPFALSHLYLTQGRGKEAKDELRRALSMDPLFAEAHLELARLEDSQGNRADSLAAFKKYLELCPDDGPALLERGELLLDDDQLDQAQKDFQAVLALSPREDRAAQGLARVAEKEGDFEKSLEWALHAVSLAPDSPVHYENLGIVYEKLNRPDKAVGAYRTYLEKGGEQTIRIRSWIERLHDTEAGSP